MKKIVAVFSTFLFLFTFPVIALSDENSSSGTAVEVVEILNATFLECMKRGDELGYSGRYDLLEPVMKRYFAFSYMVRKSSGSYWNKFDSNEQQQLLEKYITWSVGRYAQRFKKYKGQQFQILSSKLVKNKYMVVISQIVKEKKDPRVFKYILLENDGVWQIVDIQVSGISQLSLLRSQFKSLLKKKGVVELLFILDEKISQLN